MHPWPAPKACYNGGATRPEDASVAIQAQPGDLVKMVKHTHTHTHLRGIPTQFLRPGDRALGQKNSWFGRIIVEPRSLSMI